MQRAVCRCVCGVGGIREREQASEQERVGESGRERAGVGGGEASKTGTCPHKHT